MPKPNFINHAEEIYIAAEREDEAAVDTLLSRGYCIDELFTGAKSTAAGRLAAENHVNAALLLLRHGANVKYVAMGAGFANNQEFAAGLMRTHHATVDDIYWGAIINQHVAFAKSLCENVNISLTVRANAFASIGNRERAEMAFGQIPFGSPSDINALAKHAAYSGNRNHTEHLLRAYGAAASVAEGAAIAGNRDYCDELHRQYNINISEIARATAFGGHFEYAEYLRSLGAEARLIAMGAAAGGHREYAEFLRIECNIDATDVALGAAFCGQQDYAEYLREDCNANNIEMAAAANAGGYTRYGSFLNSIRPVTNYRTPYPPPFISNTHFLTSTDATKNQDFVSSLFKKMFGF